MMLKRLTKTLNQSINLKVDVLLCFLPQITILSQKLVANKIFAKKTQTCQVCDEVKLNYTFMTQNYTLYLGPIIDLSKNPNM